MLLIVYNCITFSRRFSCLSRARGGFGAQGGSMEGGRKFSFEFICRVRFLFRVSRDVGSTDDLDGRSVLSRCGML